MVPLVTEVLAARWLLSILVGGLLKIGGRKSTEHESFCPA